MELREAIRYRRSVREFLDKEVPIDVIHELVDLGNLAPSAGNLQARDFIIVRNKKVKDALARAALHQDFISEAPVVLVVCANLERIGPYGNRGRSLYAIQDASAAIQNILLAIHEKGLGAVWVGAFHEDEVSRILELPPHARPIAIIPIGYPASIPEMPERLPLEEIVHMEKW